MDQNRGDQGAADPAMDAPPAMRRQPRQVSANRYRYFCLSISYKAGRVRIENSYALHSEVTGSPPALLPFQLREFLFIEANGAGRFYRRLNHQAATSMAGAAKGK